MSYKLSIVKNKMMKRIINILILLCCIASLSSCGNSTEERSRVLKIYNWADYIDEDVLAEFPEWYKEQTGEDIRIVYQTFDINEIMLTKIEKDKLWVNPDCGLKTRGTKETEASLRNMVEAAKEIRKQA